MRVRRAKQVAWFRGEGERSTPAPQRVEARVEREREVPSTTVEDGGERPATAVGGRQHPLVDRVMNGHLFDYERLLRGRFDRIEPVLRRIAALPRDERFEETAQRLVGNELQMAIPAELLSRAWLVGLDLRALYAEAVFAAIGQCVRQAAADQAAWRSRVVFDRERLLSCRIHTLDVTPCADGRLQGLLPFALRVAPEEPAVTVKAHAGVLFDVENELADWTARALMRVTGLIEGGDTARYLKMAVYHFSSANPLREGCAAHGSRDEVAMAAARERLLQLKEAVTRNFSAEIAPLLLLVGLDTDSDAIRVHLPDAEGVPVLERSLEAMRLYEQTRSLDEEGARRAVAAAVFAALQPTPLAWQGVAMAVFLTELLIANFSQIEYVRFYHRGGYADAGHAERFLCVGQALDELHVRNMYYFAHLDTLEEGAGDVDVGVKIFRTLNVARGLPIPVLVHFRYQSRVPGSFARAQTRARRVVAAIRSRYADLAAAGLLVVRAALSDSNGVEGFSFVEEKLDRPGGH
ncbi:MAG: carboxysome shell carbonic anhydrase [Hydrogenophilus sp.]|nr:carboxysome shell carbonic anhydrase [Hydrogenophilus sp.]